MSDYFYSLEMLVYNEIVRRFEAGRSTYRLCSAAFDISDEDNQ